MSIASVLTPLLLGTVVFLWGWVLAKTFREQERGLGRFMSNDACARCFLCFLGLIVWVAIGILLVSLDLSLWSRNTVLFLIVLHALSGFVGFVLFQREASRGGLQPVIRHLAALVGILVRK